MRSATLNITTNDCDEATYNFSIQGTGTDPEVHLLGNAVNIADGDTTPSAVDHTDFKSQFVCAGAVTRTFTIQNLGNSLLNISGANLTGTHAADFSITSSPAATVAASGSTTINVTFNPSALGPRSATLNITTDDCDEATYNFAILGNGIDPEVNVQGNGQNIADGDITPSISDSTDFGVSNGGKTRSFTIENTGSATLNISSIQITGANASEFSITNAPSLINNGNNAKFYVTFTPNTNNGTRNATININNDDCDESTYNFDIKAFAGFCSFSSFSATICSNQAYFFNGANRTTTGAFNDTLVSAAGCDSLVTLNLTVNNTTTGTINQSICSNQSYFFNGANRNTAGVYKDTLLNAAGCDSVVTLNLTVTPQVTPTISISTLSSTIFPSATITFTATVTNAGTAPNYQWKRNGINVGTNDSFYITNTLLNNDSVWCVLSNANNTCQTSSTATSNKIIITVLTSTAPVVLTHRINDCTMDSFNNTGIIPSGLAGCNSTNADDDKFFIVTKPAGYSTMNIVAEGSNNFSLVLEVFSGTNLSNFVSLACVNSISSTNNEVETILLSGLPLSSATYGIRVYDSRTGGGSNAFKICVHSNNTKTSNAIPCNAINTSTANGKTVSGTLSAYDDGIYGGSISSPNSNPPFGPNLVYYQGSTAYAPFTAGVPLPTCGTTSPTPNRVYYSFIAPSMSDIGVTLRTNYLSTSKATIMEVMSATGSPCPTGFSVIKCSATGTLDLTPADLAAYQGQMLYIQLTENSAVNHTMNFMMSVQGNAPAFTIDSINTNGMRVVFPTTLTNVGTYKVYYRTTGSTGFALVNVPGSATSYKLTNLLSGVSYEVWLGYASNTSSQVFMSPKQNASTLTGCSATLPAPTAATAPAPNTSCTKVLVTWPSFANAGTAFKYRIYYRITGSTGYTILALNDTFVTFTLALNTSYDFFYKAICPTGFALSSTTSIHVTCGTPKNSSNKPINSKITINGITYNNVDFREFVLATEGNIPADGLPHEVKFEDDQMIGKENMLQVFPNPASDKAEVIYFAHPNTEPTIQLITVDGRPIQTDIIQTENVPYYGETSLIQLKTQINLSETPAGIYFIRVVQDGRAETKQLIIIK